MKINEFLNEPLLKRLNLNVATNQILQDLSQVHVLGVHEDSRFLKDGFVFFLRETRPEKSKQYLLQALNHSLIAISVSVEARILFEQLKAELLEENPALHFPPFLFFKGDLKEVYALACKHFYHNVSNQLELIGITGTDGKSTTTHILAHLLQARLYPQSVATLGTLGQGLFGEPLEHAAYSMPPPAELHQTLWQLHHQGAKAVVMEATSQGLVQKRHFGLNYRLGVFLNLTEDHLDVHKTKENYIQAKSLLFESLTNQADAVFNFEDEQSLRFSNKTSAQSHFFALYANLETAKRQIQFLIQELPKPFKGRLLIGFGVQTTEKGQVFKALAYDFSKPYTYLEEASQGMYRFELPLQAVYNVKNTLAALLSAWILGESLQNLVQILPSLQPVAGRMQEVRLDLLENTVPLPRCYIDFAHTEAGIRHVLTHFKAQQKRGKLWVFCNAAGDREREKRRAIAEVCFERADEVILTLEDVGKESPRQILADLLQGIPENRAFYFAPLRIEALRLALYCMQPEDTLVLLSLGDQKSVNFGNQAYPYCEVEALRVALLERQMREYLQQQGLDTLQKGCIPLEEYVKHYYVKDKNDFEI